MDVVVQVNQSSAILLCIRYDSCDCILINWGCKRGLANKLWKLCKVVAEVYGLVKSIGTFFYVGLHWVEMKLCLLISSSNGEGQWGIWVTSTLIFCFSGNQIYERGRKLGVRDRSRQPWSYGGLPVSHQFRLLSPVQRYSGKLSHVLIRSAMDNSPYVWINAAPLTFKKIHHLLGSLLDQWYW